MKYVALEQQLTLRVLGVTSQHTTFPLPSFKFAVKCLGLTAWAFPI